MPPRIVRTTVEIEGRMSDELALVEGKDLKGWTRDTTIVGARTPRIDGAQRVTGRARYTQDVVLPGMLHARFLRSPHARARVDRVDASRALTAPGVRGVLHRFNAPKAAFRGEETIFRAEVHFIGDEVAAVCADTAEAADAALRLIEVEYEVLPHVVDLEDAIADGAPRLEEKGNVSVSGSHSRGDAKRALEQAAIVVDATYRTSTQLHNSLETHGAVAHWDGEHLTVWESTQHVFGVRQGLQAALGIPYSRLRVICDYMGGGFGSKGGIGKYTIVAALFARQTGSPVRCVFTREEENLAAGNRSATLQRVRVGWRRGRISGLEHTSWSNSGQGRWVADPTGPTNTLYDIRDLTTKSYRVVTNAGALSAFRAPGYVEGTFALEAALDELADKAGVDPLALRRTHHARVDGVMRTRYTQKRLLECYDIGAEAIGWSKRKVGGTRGSTPHRRRGMGMASQIWFGGGGPPAYATVHLNPDGTAVVRSGTQDIGTGTRTILAQICAEELGIRVADVRVDIGDTDAPYGPISAGSLTAASVGPAVRLAAADAREQLLGAASGLMEVRKTELRVEGGKIVSKGARKPIKEIFDELANYTVIGKGSRFPNPAKVSLNTFGAHFVALEVDTGTGEVFIEKIVAVHDIGRIVNPMTAASQVEGGIIQALGFALTEERVLDRRTGRVLNADLEEYKVPTVRDVPPIVVRFTDVPDTRANNLGVKGLGEPPIIPTAAAIANAIGNATGARLRTTPMTPRRVLAALAARER
jgi:CO/xanthine dehydrogenase Mo-binding subunit